jgi:hypothetical protein
MKEIFSIIDLLKRNYNIKWISKTENSIVCKAVVYCARAEERAGEELIGYFEQEMQEYTFLKEIPRILLLTKRSPINMEHYSTIDFPVIPFHFSMNKIDINKERNSINILQKVLLSACEEKQINN